MRLKLYNYQQKQAPQPDKPHPNELRNHSDEEEEGSTIKGLVSVTGWLCKIKLQSSEKSMLTQQIILLLPLRYTFPVSHVPSLLHALDCLTQGLLHHIKDASQIDGMFTSYVGVYFGLLTYSFTNFVHLIVVGETGEAKSPPSQLGNISAMCLGCFKSKPEQTFLKIYLLQEPSSMQPSGLFAQWAYISRNFAAVSTLMGAKQGGLYTNVQIGQRILSYLIQIWFSLSRGSRPVVIENQPVRLPLQLTFRPVCIQ